MKPQVSSYLVVSTLLKTISEIGSCLQIGLKITNIWNHHLGRVENSQNIWVATTCPFKLQNHQKLGFFHGICHDASEKVPKTKLSQMVVEKWQFTHVERVNKTYQKQQFQVYNP